MFVSGWKELESVGWLFCRLALLMILQYIVLRHAKRGSQPGVYNVRVGVLWQLESLQMILEHEYVGSASFAKQKELIL